MQNRSIGVNVVSGGVRVSGGHLYEVEAPTEAAAETSFTNLEGSSNLLRNHNTTKVVYSTNYSSSFHIYKNLLALQDLTVSICKHTRFILLLLSF